MRFERQGRLRGASFIEQAALHYACRQTRHETADMHFRLNTFCGGPWPLEQFLSHRKTPKDQITSICVYFHFSEHYLLVPLEWYAPFRAAVKALSGLKDVSILVDHNERWMKRKNCMALVERFKRLLDLDREGVVLITPQVPENSTEEPNLDDSG